MPGRLSSRPRSVARSCRRARAAVPKDEEAGQELKKRTLTNLYNARPQWLANAHAALDQAVADAYGWGEDWRASRPVLADVSRAHLAYTAIAGALASGAATAAPAN